MISIIIITLLFVIGMCWLFSFNPFSFVVDFILEFLPYCDRGKIYLILFLIFGVLVLGIIFGIGIKIGMGI